VLRLEEEVDSSRMENAVGDKAPVLSALVRYASEVLTRVPPGLNCSRADMLGTRACCLKKVRGYSSSGEESFFAAQYGAKGIGSEAPSSKESMVKLH
jgi:hypothetical protein